MFGKSEGKNFADMMEISYLGDLPLTEKVSDSANKGRAMVSMNSKSPVTKNFLEMADKITTDFLEE